MNSYPRWADAFASAFANNQHVATALLAYAAGDAFGVFYEFLPRSSEPIESKLFEKKGWPYGGVSDDTLLSLLTIQALAEQSPQDGAQKFLSLLHENIPNLRGLGPTTRTALGLPVRSDERGEIGNTNGAIMRTALVGLYFDPENAHERRLWVESLVKTTHQGDRAHYCAQLCAAIFSRNLLTIEETIRLELSQLCNVPPDVAAIMETLETWNPPANGISLDPLETLLAVLWVVSRSKNFEDTYSLACSLGGDTDTVAALAGALFAVRAKDSSRFFEIDWLEEVRWSEIAAGVNLAAKVRRR